MKPELMPFVAPLFLFSVFLSVESYFPGQHYVLYPIVTIVVAAAIGWYWRALPALVPTSVIGSVAVGGVGIILWVGLDPLAMLLDRVLEQFYNGAVSDSGFQTWSMPIQEIHPAGLDPFAVYPAAEAWILFGFRLAGISLCVPIMEELFWRGFLMRWLIQENFTAVPIGTYQPASFWITTAFFALVHGPEWSLGVVVGVLYGFWFVRTKSLGDIMLAHGVTNLLLALYCLLSGDWHFLSSVTPAPALK
jgi:membrane protease YdiL (CAAX protease family)